jgi:hypothetical protein
MCSEYLDKGDLQSRNLAVEEDAGQIKLDLETNIDICPINAISQ